MRIASSAASDIKWGRWMTLPGLAGAFMIALHIPFSRLTKYAHDKHDLARAVRPTACTYERLRRMNASDVRWEPQATEPSNNLTARLSPHRLRVRTCKLDPFWHPEPARACLGDRHVVLVGDSLTRYMYLNFVHYLENGLWEGPRPYNEVETEWPTWNDFYKGTNARLNGHEICDCFRSTERPMEDILENRYYYNPAHNIRVSYIQLFMHDWGIRGHNRTWLGDPFDGRVGDGQGPRPTAPPPPFAQKGCLPGECDGQVHPFHWQQGIIESLEGHIADMEPDVVILNTGLWEPMPGKLDIHRLVAAGHKAVAKKDGRVFFKTTTTNQDADRPVDADKDFAAIVESYGWKILDAGLFTLPLKAMEAELKSVHGHVFYWDISHFYPPVYAGLNQLMLNMLCHRS